jgi:hypothetical protein
VLSEVHKKIAVTSLVLSVGQELCEQECFSALSLSWWFFSLPLEPSLSAENHLAAFKMPLWCCTISIWPMMAPFPMGSLLWIREAIFMERQAN